MERKCLHEVRLFICEHRAHEARAIHVLLGSPGVPRILSVVQVGEDGDLKGPVRLER